MTVSLSSVAPSSRSIALTLVRVPAAPTSTVLLPSRLEDAHVGEGVGAGAHRHRAAGQAEVAEVGDGVVARLPSRWCRRPRRSSRVLALVRVSLPSPKLMVPPVPVRTVPALARVSLSAPRVIAPVWMSIRPPARLLMVSLPSPKSLLWVPPSAPHAAAAVVEDIVAAVQGHRAGDVAVVVDGVDRRRCRRPRRHGPRSPSRADRRRWPRCSACWCRRRCPSARRWRCSEPPAWIWPALLITASPTSSRWTGRRSRPRRRTPSMLPVAALLTVTSP